MRQLPDRTWVAKEKVWSIPEESIHAEDLRQKLETIATVLSEQEVAAIIRSLTNIKHKTIIALIYSAGLRVSEAVSLRITDLEFDRGLIRIVQGKGKKDRIVPLSARLYAMIQEYQKEYQPKTWLFEGQKSYSAYIAAQLCNTFTGKKTRFANYSGTTRSQ